LHLFVASDKKKKKERFGVRPGQEKKVTWRAGESRSRTSTARGGESVKKRIMRKRLYWPHSGEEGKNAAPPGERDPSTR